MSFRVARRAAGVVLLMAWGAMIGPGVAASQPRSAVPPIAQGPDFNGDGFADLTMPFFGEDVGSIRDAGAVEVIYGSRSGPQTASPRAQLWTQDTPGVPDRAEPGDQFGWAVAFGDFNGDGFADLVIGAPFEDLQGVPDAGAIEVLYGSAAGLQTNAPPAQLWTRNSPGVAGAARAGDALGRSLAVGDLNGDGFADLAAGGQRMGVAGIPAAGGAEILYGSAAGLQATGAGAPDDQLWTQDSHGVPDASEPGDWFGRSVAVGDFNGDGYDDLAAGAPFEDVGAIRDAGAVTILFGSSAGLQSSDPPPQLWTESSPGLGTNAGPGNLFGRNLASGDFDGDGFADLAVAVRYESVGSSADAGSVVVLSGSSRGLDVASHRAQVWTQDSPPVQDQAEPGDVFGRAVATGDFNDDGFLDLAVGVPFEDLDGVSNAGAVEVLYGGPQGLQTGRPPDQLWSQGSNGVRDRKERGDAFGVALYPADYDGSGTADLAVAILFEDVGSVKDAGAFEVLFGARGGGLEADGRGAPDDQFWTQNSPGVPDRAEPGDGGYASSKPARHRLLRYIEASVALLLLAAAGLWLWMRWRSGRRRRGSSPPGLAEALEPVSNPASSPRRRAVQ